MTATSGWARIVAAAADPRATATPAQRYRLLDDALQLAAAVTPESVGASITEAVAEGYRTTAAANQLAFDLDRAQYAAHEGPCLAACDDRRPHRVIIVAGDSAYPVFTAAAFQRGVRSSLSLPMAAARPSALNLYTSSETTFDRGQARRTAEFLARCIARFLPDPAPATSAEEGQLAQALARRQLLERAQAVLAEQDGLDDQAAYRRLTRRSRLRGDSIYAIARDVVDEESAGGAR